jgi:hypothetical protein
MREIARGCTILAAFEQRPERRGKLREWAFRELPRSLPAAWFPARAETGNLFSIGCIDSSRKLRPKIAPQINERYRPR